MVCEDMSIVSDDVHQKKLINQQEGLYMVPHKIKAIAVCLMIGQNKDCGKTKTHAHTTPQ